MKHLKKYKVFESANSNFYWEGASESIDIITKILKFNNLKFKHTHLTDDESENIDGDHSSGSELYIFEFLDLDDNHISIHIAPQEKDGDDIKDDNDDFFSGISVLVLLFNSNLPNEDGAYLESGKDLMNELSKLELPLPNWIKKINEE